MNDCPNADVRDLLPDLVHERLDAETRAMVEAHVRTCTDCAAELELLRQLRAARRTPRVDVASIVAAVPPYRAPARRSWVGWRAAAAITVLVAGASSVAVLRRGDSALEGVATRTIAAPVPASVSQGSPLTTPEGSSSVQRPQSIVSVKSIPPVPVATPGSRVPAVTDAARELAMGGGALGDLDDRELASLLKDIESLDAVPSVEVESSPMSPIPPSARVGP